MNEPMILTGMRNAQGAGTVSPVLQGVQARGRLDGLMLELSVRQTYRNTSRDTLEVIYTFPLPMAAVLLGLDVELGGRRLAGQVTARREAEHRYEEALADGDTPVLLERSGSGLYTAALGNLLPGEEAVIEYRYGQLLAFEQDQVRLCIPTTVAPRYGDPVAGGGLQPQQVPHATIEAEHRLSLQLDFGADWSEAEIGCATHACSMRRSGDGVQLALRERAWLDRDVVVTLRPGTLMSTAQAVADGERQVVLASFQPRTDSLLRPRIDLKVLVDCSGSMAGDSIASAREALAQVARQLRETDRFTFSRFGNTVQHAFRRLTPARSTNVAMLQAMIATTDANLGGTEMEDALKSTIALPGPGDAAADVLLITDGEVWQVDSMVEAAAASGHRIFAVGVGSAPAESLLRSLAERSGGACEFATPGESLAAAVDRMFARLRQQPLHGVRPQWLHDGRELQPDWVAGLPDTMFGGDTVHVFAGFSSPAPTHTRLVTAGPGGAPVATAAVAPPQAARHAGTPDALPRLAAASRLPAAAKDEALALALRYQLVTDQTHCLVVHQRTAEAKARDFAQLHQVPPMLAAGWGGSSSVVRGVLHEQAAPAPKLLDTLGAASTSMPLPAPVSLRAAAPERAKRSAAAPMMRRAAPQKPGAAPVDTAALLLAALAALASEPARGLDAALPGLKPGAGLAPCIDAMVALGLTRRAAWAVLVRWLVERDGTELTPAQELRLEDELRDVSTEQWTGALSLLNRHVPVA